LEVDELKRGALVDMRKQKKDDISFKNKGMNVVFLMDSLSAICKNHVFQWPRSTPYFFNFMKA
ncbi:hypothetical protein, partial [Paenibacillus sp. 23TSA30-6]|uniref:hypothetical protein n=1 Tax=Paenibacillus sp. 23TSA30-6 TaxID=2546104 RepID=UPI001EE1F0A6